MWLCIGFVCLPQHRARGIPQPFAAVSGHRDTINVHPSPGWSLDCGNGGPRRATAEAPCHTADNQPSHCDPDGSRICRVFLRCRRAGQRLSFSDRFLPSPTLVLPPHLRDPLLLHYCLQHHLCYCLHSYICPQLTLPVRASLTTKAAACFPTGFVARSGTQCLTLLLAVLPICRPKRIPVTRHTS